MLNFIVFTEELENIDNKKKWMAIVLLHGTACLFKEKRGGC